MKASLVDEDTGKPLLGNLAVMIPKRQNGFERWLAMAQDPAHQVASTHRKELGGEGLAVLFEMFARLDFENLLMMSQAEVAKSINMKPQNFQRSLKKLIALDIILEGPKTGIHKTYRLNPSFGWKGSAKSHLAALEKRMQARGLRVAAVDGATVDQPDDHQTDIEDFLTDAPK